MPSQVQTDRRGGARATSEPYLRVLGLLRAGACVILDGATGTELPHVTDAEHALDERLWGTRALVERSDAVLRVHERYVEAGCDLISTNTWGLPSALLLGSAPVWSSTEPVHCVQSAKSRTTTFHWPGCGFVNGTLSGSPTKPESTSVLSGFQLPSTKR